MGSLTTCLKKAGSAISAQDKADIIERAKSLRADGANALDAALKAVEEQIASVQALLDGGAQTDAKAPAAQPEVDAVSAAQPVAEAPTDTHSEPGQPAEPATPTVVAEAITKAAGKRDIPASEMRATALKLIDEAIAKAPSMAAVDQQIGIRDPVTERGKRVMRGSRGFDEVATLVVEARETQDDKWTVTDESYDGSGKGTKRRTVIGELVGTPAVARDQLRKLLRRANPDGSVGEPDMVRIQVPGDGTFKVLNTKEDLATFRKKVESSPGFKDKPTRFEAERVNGYGTRQESGAPFGVEGGSGGPKAAVANMIDDGDPQAAVDYAAARGMNIADLLKGDKVRLPKVAGLTPTAEQIGEFEPDGGQPVISQDAPEASPVKETGVALSQVDATTAPSAAIESRPESERKRAQTAPTPLKDRVEANRQGEQAGLNDRDHFTLDRGTSNNQMERVTFARGEYITYRVGEGGRQAFGEIDGISHVKREFSVDGLWYPFGFAYKAERPPEGKKNTVHLSSVVDEVNAKSGEGLTTADAVSPLQAFKDTISDVYDGKASVEVYRAAYQRVRDAAAVKAELGKMTKEELTKTFGILRDGKKDELVDLAYESMLRQFALRKEYGPNSYFMTRGGYENYQKLKAEALDALVAGQTAEDLAAFADERKRAREADQEGRAKLAESVKDPKTLEDFRRYVSLKEREGKSFAEARMMLTPEQRALMDDLSATETRSRRTTIKDEQRTQVRVAGQTVDGQIIATKHTKKGHALYVVKLSERVSREDYDTLNAGAKRIGGYYSSFRGGGAIPGFQFTTREQAEAFVKLASGDNTAAQEAAQMRRDAYADDRSQTAAERLTEMADRMEADADESLGRERKANTERRARFAAAAEAGARESKAMAKTMRNIAQAMTNGAAKFLDRVRTKTQVELLQTYVANSKDAELRAKYPSYAEQEKRKGQPPTQETADYAEFPQYTAFRSDLASLGRQLLEVDGTKKLGERLMKVSDDVGEAFTAWAKEPGNFYRVATFGSKDGGRAMLPSKDAAERAIARSGYRGKAIPWSIKRGEWTVIMSPSEAMARGIWTGDGDKRITLSAEFGAELVEKIGRANRRGEKVSVPWQFERAHERRKQLARMGLETPAEFRAALREFIGLREQAAEADRIKALERAMVGKAKDGLDFFPTPASVADEMVAAADIKPGMAVLEPSAGMGHIADRIRTAGAEPDVIELSGDRRELLQEKGYYVQPYNDFLQMELRSFYTFGDVMRAPDGVEGIMHGGPGWSGRASLHEENADWTEGKFLGWYDRSELVGVRHRGRPGTDSGGYDRIIMNPPFSEGRDIQHVRHAYSLLKPGGRIVAIMGESAFTNQNKRATEFREWLESVGGTEEKLPAGSFLDPSLPANTGANARMVVIDKPDAAEASPFSRRAYRPVGVPMRDAEAIVAGVRRALPKAPPIVLLESVEKAPNDLVSYIKASGAEDDVEAVYHKGTIYVFPSHMASMERMEFVVARHEIRHHGFRHLIGPSGGATLLEMAKSNPELDREAMNLLAQKIARSKVEAIEEALADMPAERLEALSGWDKFITALRAGLRRMAMRLRAYGLLGVADAIEPSQWTDRDLASFVLKAERVSVNGAPSATMFSRPRDAFASVREMALPAGRILDDYLKANPGKLSWWHKTVGTMHNLAQRDPWFKRVYDSANRFLNDVSLIATEAANLAPTLLPKIEGLRDLGKQPLPVEDTKAISRPIFEGTLNWTRDADGTPMPTDDVEKAGVVWSNDELRSMFGLDERQIGLYREFRKAADKSLTDLTITDMIRYAGEDADSVAAEMMNSGDVTRAADVLQERLAELAEIAGEDRAASLTETGRVVGEKAANARRLMARGYAPLMRFGHYTVDVTEGDDRIGFWMFESKAEANQAERRMREAFPNASVQTGTMSEQQYKLFSGVNPETMELFGHMLGLESAGDSAMDVAFQQYIKLTKNNRSAMKRLMHRAGVEGFSEDAGRVLAGFVYSNARQSSKNLHMGHLTQAVVDLAEQDRGKGERLDAAVRLHDYISKPTEEGHKIKGLMFAQFLGGSLAAGMVNLSQSVMVTFPYLTQFGSVSQAAGLMRQAMRDALKWETQADETLRTTGDSELDAAMRRAEEEGIVSPQEVHHLIAQAGGAGALKSGDGTTAGDLAATGSNFLSKVMLAWGRPFAVAEQFNRRVAFIAAYRTAAQNGMENPAAFAEKAVVDTQFSYTRANRPQWARGTVGSVLFTFKTFSISYVELLSRMAASGPEGRKAALVGLTMLFLMSGLQGLPGSDDMDDVIDGLLQRMGYNFSSKRAKREFFASILGDGGARFVLQGVSGLPGAPIDVAGRLGLGNLIPGTGLLTKKADYGRDVAEIAGPVASLATQIGKGASKIVDGEPVEAIKSVLPVALQNAVKAYDMATTGVYKDDRGRKVIDVDEYDAMAKAIGFQPADVAAVQKATAEVQKSIALTKMRESEIADKWAKGVADGDREAVAEAMTEMRRWNADNPEAMIRIDTAQILKRVKAIKMSKEERIAKTAPREMRAEVRRELESARP